MSVEKEYWKLVRDESLVEQIDIIREWLSNSRRRNSCPLIVSCNNCCNAQWPFLKGCCPCNYLVSVVYCSDSVPFTEREILVWLYKLLVEGVKEQIRRGL